MNNDRDHDPPPRPTAAATITTPTATATTTTKGPSPRHQMIIQQHPMIGGGGHGEKQTFDFTSAAAAVAVGDFQFATTMMNARPMKPLPRSKRRRTGDGAGTGAGAGSSDDDIDAGSDVGILNGVNGGNHAHGAVLGSFSMQLRWPSPPVSGASLLRALPPAEDGPAMTSDGDDHRREERDHQGNTKKRKVPAAAHHHFRHGSSGEDDVLALVGGGANDAGAAGANHDERYGRDDFHSEPRTLNSSIAPTNLTSTSAGGISASLSTVVFGAALTARQRARLPHATNVHLRMRDVVRKRRRLMVGVLPPNAEITPEAEVAIVRALSDPTLNWTLRGPEAAKPLVGPRAREKRREIAALPRRLKVAAAVPGDEREAEGRKRRGMPEGPFVLLFSSPASERMRQVLEDVASYKDRFRVELARLATARRIAGIASPSPGVDAKRGQTGSRKKLTTTTTTTTMTTTNGSTTTTTTSYSRPGAGGPGLGMNDVDGHRQLNGTGKSNTTPNNGTSIANGNGNGGSANGGKKNKKRTGNNSKASDPHRTGSYIPSRLPTAAGVPASLTPAQAAASLAALVSPLPVRLLSADVPQRQRRRRNNVNVASSLPPVQPELEWICPFCEYDLFFGGEERWRRAVRARKKLLGRRRRARERAAMAASGQGGGGRGLSRKHGGEDEEEGGDEGEEEEEEEDILNQEARFEDPEAVEARVNANVRSVLRDKDKDRDRGGGGGFNVPVLPLDMLGI